MQSTTKVKKERKAEHYYLNAAGTVVDDIEEATGVRYVDRQVGATFDWQVLAASPASQQTMMAVFGMKTYATNAASTARQAGEDGHGQVEAIRQKAKSIDAGSWPEIEREVLPTDLPLAAKAARIVALEGKAIKNAQADAFEAAILAKFQADADSLKEAWQVPGMRTAYRKLQGKSVKGADSLLTLAGMAS